MAELTRSDMIWNRACDPNHLRTLPGDRALADMLRAHGLAMNGGVLHAVECLTTSQLSDAEAGYRFYGLGDIATLLSRARTIFEIGEDLGNHEKQLDKQYAEMVSSDDALVERFERHLASNPSDFASL